ncbi:MAG: NAD-glutamate dehydrogenase, partial [Micavibrio aeruginosavorus]|nr:NAD-glutamate dehydrogenase [Micavibrio aeruginosavorus]
TARGAWESVKRHFRELGTDIQTTDFDVVGVGDMAGDVFGNGMLLSPHIRLVGAFNHVHIVCDPNPDVASSFKERERLFREVKGWDHYDTKLLSKGGRIYNRSEKSLTLTPEIMARFDIAKDKVTPAELMNAMLKARTDLLWFGGIGTFIKATSESHADAGDKANEAFRIDAPEIRAKVVGEGANLGCTQKARVEYAALGGRINADFIDNSGGVNSSDVEVNIKIAMTDIMHNPANKMDLQKRNVLLAKMTEEVAGLVLRNSYQQVQGISLMTLQAPQTLITDAQFIRVLERDQGLKRKLENLPDEEEIERRRAAGLGLYRPELCIVQSYAKIAYTSELLASDIPDQPEMQDFLISYFPKPMQEKYTDDLLGHQLGREIIAMRIANSIVNRMGAAFIKSRMDATGASCADVVRAFLVVREAFGLRDLWDRIEALDRKIPAMVQLRAMMGLQETADRAITWFLTRLGRTPNLAKDIPAFREQVDKLRAGADGALPAGLKAIVAQRLQDALGNGLPEKVARDISLLPVLDSAFDIIRITAERKGNIAAAAKAYFRVGEYFHVDSLRAGAEAIPAADRWAQEARSGLIEQLYGVQAALAVQYLKEPEETAEAQSIKGMIESILNTGTIDTPRLMIAIQRLQQLAAR